MSFTHANIVSILVAAVAAWIFGGIYYTGLGKWWMAAQGKTLEQCKAEQASKSAVAMAAPFVLVFLAEIIMLKPGGVLVYCVCSLEPEECEDQIAALLTRDPRITRKPVTPQDVFECREFVTDDGDLRTLPMHLPDSDPRWGGLDGFYAARLTCKSA